MMKSTVFFVVFILTTLSSFAYIDKNGYECPPPCCYKNMANGAIAGFEYHCYQINATCNWVCTLK